MLVSVAKLAKVGRTEVDVPSPISLGAAVTRVAYLLSFNKSVVKCEIYFLRPAP